MNVPQPSKLKRTRLLLAFRSNKWKNIMKKHLVNISDSCYAAAGFIAFVLGLAIMKIINGNGMGAAIGFWVLGAVVLAPITVPLFLVGKVLDVVFDLDSVRKENAPLV